MGLEILSHGNKMVRDDKRSHTILLWQTQSFWLRVIGKDLLPRLDGNLRYVEDCDLFLTAFLIFILKETTYIFFGIRHQKIRSVSWEMFDGFVFIVSRKEINYYLYNKIR